MKLTPLLGNTVAVVAVEVAVEVAVAAGVAVAVASVPVVAVEVGTVVVVGGVVGAAVAASRPRLSLAVNGTELAVAAKWLELELELELLQLAGYSQPRNLRLRAVVAL